MHAFNLLENLMYVLLIFLVGLKRWGNKNMYNKNMYVTCMFKNMYVTCMFC